MRTAIAVVGATLLVVSACSMFDRSPSSENVKTAYAGPASMTAQQLTDLLHAAMTGWAPQLPARVPMWTSIWIRTV